MWKIETIGTILLVIELIQDVKTAVNLIKMGNKIFLLTFEKWCRFLIFIQTSYLTLSLWYFNVRESMLMQLTQPANNSKNASDHCCDQLFPRVSITQVQKTKKHYFWKISYHSWFGTNDNKTSERKQNHKLCIINTAFIRGFTCMLNFAISWIQCPHNDINNNITVSISRNPGHSVFHQQKRCFTKITWQN